MDGNYTLAETESAIQAKEAAGREMITLEAGDSDPPTNEADYKKLSAGKRPSPLHLTQTDIPAGKPEVWSGSIYVEGTLQEAKAYRE
jgi:hypothetical protein